MIRYAFSSGRYAFRLENEFERGQDERQENHLRIGFIIHVLKDGSLK